jgi:hypothetical protein
MHCTVLRSLSSISKTKEIGLVKNSVLSNESKNG